MKIMNGLRKLRANPVLIKLARLLHLQVFIRKIYYKFILFRNNKIKIKLFGYEAQFYARRFDECNNIENFLNDEWRENRVIQRIFLELKPKDVAYDIGASIGTHALFMALKLSPHGRVFAFEPESDSFRILKDNILLNKMQNIMVFQAALGDYAGEVSIRKVPWFTVTDNSNFALANKVRLAEGDVFIKENNLPLPSVVKIDVEGFEYYVIKGLENTLKNPVCRMVACEIHPTLLSGGTRVSDILELLESYGYKKNEIFKRLAELHAFFYKD